MTDPLTAAVEALAHLGLRRVALISPYAKDVQETMIRHFAACGVETVSSFSFEEERELGVASIPPERILSEVKRDHSYMTSAVRGRQGRLR